MHIEVVVADKKRFLDLLLLGDEQEDMIDRYLERGELFVLCGPELMGVCVVTEEGNGRFEIKNIAIDRSHQGKGYGKLLIEHLFAHYQGKGTEMYVGTGDGTKTVRFYQSCGFVVSHRIKNFFTENYDHPIIEDGTQLVDMVYLKRAF